MTETERGDTFFAGALGALLAFAALANAAHDLWAALLVYTGAAFLAAGVVARAAFQSAGQGLRLDLWKPLALLLAVFFWSAFRGVHPDEARLEALDWAAATLVFFVALNTLSSDKARRLFLAIMVPVLCIEAATVIRQKIQMGPAEYLTDIAPGTLVNASVGACFALVWLPLFAQEQHEKKSPLWSVGLLAGGMLIGLFMSTWALVCLLLGAPFFFRRYAILEFVRRHRRVALGACVAAALLITAIVAVKFGAARFFSNPNLPLVYTSRTAWWLSALKMFKDYPLFGVGLGNFPSAFLAYKVGMGQHTFYAHSALFSVLAETGLAGLIALGVFLSAGFRSAPRTEESWGLWGSLLIYMAFVSMSVSYEYLLNLLVPFALAGALLASKPGRMSRPRPAMGLVAVVLAVGVPLLLYPLFVASQRLVQGRQEISEGRVDEAARSFQISAELNPLAYEPHQELARLSFGRYGATMDTAYLDAALAHSKKALERNRLDVLLKQELAYFERGAGR